MNKSKLLSAVVIVLGVLIAASALGVTVYFTSNAASIGEDIGNGMGKAAGLALGSFDGITKGLGEGEDAGTSEGLSAKDTTAELANEIKKVGRLQVLNMNITLSDVFSVGADGSPDSSTGYFALLIFEGTASYTVDLEQCGISVDDEAVKVTVPRPELRITIDPEKTQKRAENNSALFSDGSSFKGYTAYINTLKQAKEKVGEKIAGYEGMKQTAESSAVSAVGRLAGMVRLDDKPIIVEFADDNEVIEIAEKEVKA